MHVAPASRMSTQRSHRRLGRALGASVGALVVVAGLVTAVPAGVASASTPTYLTVSIPSATTYGTSATALVTVTAASGPNPTSGTIVVSDSWSDFSCTLTLSGSNTSDCLGGFTEVGPDTISASYAGDGSFGSSSGTASATVSKASVSLFPSVAAASVGQTTTVTVNVSPATAVLNGDFTITDQTGAVSCTDVSASDPVTCTGAPLPRVGDDVITVNWAGNADYNPSSATTTLAVAKASTLIASITAAPSQVGQRATITVQVDPHPDGGLVTLTDGDGQISCANLAVSTSTGQATCTTGTLSGADVADVLTAQYLGDADYLASSGGASGSLEIDRGTTNLALTASPQPSVGSTSTFTATVSPLAGAQAAPTGGTVAFSDTTNRVSDCGSVATGGSPLSASCASLAYSSTGSDTVTADYGGSTNWAPSTGSTTFQIEPGTSALSVTIVPPHPTVGQAAIVTAVVSPTDGNGTVDFSGPYLSGCSAVPLSGDSAMCTSTPFTSAGTWDPMVGYSGDENYASAGTFTGSVTISPAPTTVLLDSSVTNPAAFSADVVAAAVSPVPDGGSVAFSDSNGRLPGCSNVAVSTASGVATCPIAALPGAGTDELTASYSGDSNYQAETGSLALGIAKVGTTITVTPATSAATVGDTAALAITVSPPPDGGTVTVSDSYGDLSCAGVAVSSSTGEATCTTRTLSPAGSDALSASYSGDADYAAANGTGEIAVERVSSSLTVSSADAVGVVGQQLHLAVRVSPAPTSGTVAFSDALGELSACAQVPVNASTGVASCTSGTLSTEGADTITATFGQTTTEASSTLSTSVPIDQQPYLTGSTTVTEVTGAPSSAALHLDGFPAPSVTASEALPSGLSLTPAGAVTGVPAFGSGGVYQVPIVISNSLSSFSTTLTIVVDQAPAVSSATSFDAAYGVPSSIQVTTAPGSYPTPSLSLSGGVPAGMTFRDDQDGTATISGTPDDFVSGPQRFAIVASSPAGSVETPLTIVVTGTPAPPAPATGSTPSNLGRPSDSAALSALAAATALHRAGAVPSAGSEPIVIPARTLPATYDPLGTVVLVRRHHKVVRKLVKAWIGADATTFPVLGNIGPYGDCTVVAVSNIVRIDHVEGRFPLVPKMTENEAIGEWSAISGASGQGLTDGQLLHAWAGQAGVLGTHIRGWRLLDPQAIWAVKEAIRADGGLYAGILLPENTAVGTTIDPLLSPNTAVGGHALVPFGWTPHGFLAISWGEVVLIPYSWWSQYATTAYAVNLVRPVARHKASGEISRSASRRSGARVTSPGSSARVRTSARAAR